MGIVKKSSGIDFADLSIKKAFEELTETNKELHKHLIRAFNDILENAFCGRAVHTARCTSNCGVLGQRD